MKDDQHVLFRKMGKDKYRVTIDRDSSRLKTYRVLIAKDTYNPFTFKTWEGYGTTTTEYVFMSTVETVEWMESEWNRFCYLIKNDLIDF